MTAARAFWTTAAGQGEIRSASAPDPKPGEARLRTLVSAISPGTERLIFRGGAPESLWSAMRCPHQDGDFPFPVKYGYACVGVVEDGPSDWVGARAFCLHPHQTRFTVPLAALRRLPDALPTPRAALAANMETAVNALWDAGPRLGDRIAVVGCGVVGLLVAGLAVRIPGCAVQAIDPDPARRARAARLGADAVEPDAAAPDADLVIHASATEAGLACALRLARLEGTVLELSWYGDQAPRAPLGEAFHPRRLKLISSQVGRLAPAQAVRWTDASRAAFALSLLADPDFDAIWDDAGRFDDLPAIMAAVAAGGGAPAPIIRYEEKG
ncbi:MAG: zinc-binding alcohol dehydrogenase [Pseudomonadota bacterium]